MFRKLALAAFAALTLGAGLASAPAPASAQGFGFYFGSPGYHGGYHRGYHGGGYHRPYYRPYYGRDYYPRRYRSYGPPRRHCERIVVRKRVYGEWRRVVERRCYPRRWDY